MTAQARIARRWGDSQGTALAKLMPEMRPPEQAEALRRVAAHVNAGDLELTSMSVLPP